MYNEFNFLVQINSVDDKYAFVVSTNNADTPTRLVVSTLSFESETQALLCVPSAMDIYRLTTQQNHFLTIFHQNSELELIHQFDLIKKQYSDDWDGIVRQGNGYFKCREDAIINFPELEALLPATSSDKPQMLWGVVGIKPDKDAWYYVKDDVVYVDKQVAKEQMKQAGIGFSIFGFEVK